jgi:hypothetical protein
MNYTINNEYNAADRMRRATICIFYILLEKVNTHASLAMYLAVGPLPLVRTAAREEFLAVAVVFPGSKGTLIIECLLAIHLRRIMQMIRH